MSDNHNNNYLTNVNAEPTSTYAQVLEAHRVLNTEIEAMNDKIEKTMEKHQGEFLHAYQNHIRKIKYELESIRKKSDEQENQLKNNERVYFLEKQIVIFRDEALKLYDRLDEKTQEAEIYRIKMKDLEQTCFISQKEVRELSKNRKMMEAKIKAQENRIFELEKQLRNRTDVLSKASILGTESNTKAITMDPLTVIKNTTSKKSQDTPTNKNTALGFRKKTISYIGLNRDSELKEWFIECIKSIKRDVAYRKHSGYQFDLNTINSIEEFKMVDKLKLLEKFMENEKLLTWMYEKIFPSRIAEVKEYLSQRSISIDPSKKLPETVGPSKTFESMLEFNEDNIPLENVILPKMSEPSKVSKYNNSQIRNRISMKQGKLNLSSF